MKRHEADRLLDEILAGDEISEFRRASLAQALQALESRKRRRRAWRTGALVTLPLLLLVAVFPGRAPEQARPERSRSEAGNAVSPQAGAAPVKHITDEELLALFPGRPMALIGPPGHQRLVFLDRSTRQAGAKKL